MKVVLQRVTKAGVTVEGEEIAKIEGGILCLVAFKHGDTSELFEKAVEKILALRIFPDEAGRFDKSVEDSKGETLWVPQFTLYGECGKGRRPSFTESLPSAEAKELFATFQEFVSLRQGTRAQFGSFGANMQISLCNDGPVTLIIDF